MSNLFKARIVSDLFFKVALFFPARYVCKSLQRRLADKQLLPSDAWVGANVCEKSAAWQLQSCAANRVHVYAVVRAVQANAAQKVIG